MAGASLCDACKEVFETAKQLINQELVSEQGHTEEPVDQEDRSSTEESGRYLVRFKTLRGWTSTATESLCQLCALLYLQQCPEFGVQPERDLDAAFDCHLWARRGRVNIALHDPRTDTFLTEAVYISLESTFKQAPSVPTHFIPMIKRSLVHGQRRARASFRELWQMPQPGHPTLWSSSQFG